MNTYTCHRCGMSFRVVDRFDPRVEASRCAEAICGMRMASSSNPNAWTARVYVERSTAEARESAA